jgi:SSS family solute:Na+ symporter
LFILYLPTQFVCDFQLLGCLWILQVFPAVVFCLFTRWFLAPALIAGWAVVGLIGGTYLSWVDGLKPLHLVSFGDLSFTMYVGLIALVANIVTAVVINTVLIGARKQNHAFDGAP